MTTSKINPSPDSVPANELPEFKQWQAERTLGSVMRAFGQRLQRFRWIQAWSQLFLRWSWKGILIQ